MNYMHTSIANSATNFYLLNSNTSYESIIYHPKIQFSAKNQKQLLLQVLYQNLQRKIPGVQRIKNLPCSYILIRESSPSSLSFQAVIINSYATVDQATSAYRKKETYQFKLN